MAEQLYPVFDIPTADIRPSTSSVDAYKHDYLFDFNSGDFVVDGNHRVPTADGWTAWTQWCLTQCTIERFALLAYDANAGIDYALIREQDSRATREAVLERSITEALMIDKRTAGVSGFEYEWNGDSVLVNMTVSPVSGADFALQTTINL